MIDILVVWVCGSWHEKNTSLAQSPSHEMITQRNNLVWLTETDKAGMSGPSD